MRAFYGAEGSERFCGDGGRRSQTSVILRGMEERRASAATASAPMSCGSGSSCMRAGPMQQQQQQGMGCTRDWRNADAAGGIYVCCEPRRFHGPPQCHRCGRSGHISIKCLAPNHEMIYWKYNRPGPFQQQRRNGEFGDGSVCWQQQQQKQPGVVHGGDSQQQPRQQQLADGLTGGAGGQVSGGVFVGEKGGGAAAGSSAVYLPVKAPANVASHTVNTHSTTRSPQRPATSRVVSAVVRQRDELDLMEGGYSSRRVAEEHMLGLYHVVVVSPSAESQQPKHSSEAAAAAALSLVAALAPGTQTDAAAMAAASTAAGAAAAAPVTEGWT
ncbi:unnamed protein product [Ectocarpus sp. CCAP 1310/34]|nr:unnamed protein product [Ectocarpus sp. CCAP 1310/34]